MSEVDLQPMSSSDFQKSPFHNACITGDLDKAQHIIETEESTVTPRLQSALTASITAGQAAVVSYLLEKGAELRPRLVNLATGHNRSTAIFQAFLDHGWNINSKAVMDSPALRYVIADQAIVQWFLDHGADPTAGGGPGSSMLDVAAANSSTDILDLLISYGAKLSESDALHSAAGYVKVAGEERVKMMEHLLNLGMEINAIERRKFPPGRKKGQGTPLHSAVYAQTTKRILFLLEKGADRKIVNTLGQTPLEYAIAHDKHVAAECLKQE